MKVSVHHEFLTVAVADRLSHLGENTVESLLRNAVEHLSLEDSFIEVHAIN